MTAETDRMLAEALTKLSAEDRAKYDDDMAAYGRAVVIVEKDHENDCDVVRYVPPSEWPSQKPLPALRTPNLMPGELAPQTIGANREQRRKLRRLH
jgi:hypothetical protein